ncbi:MAG: undecaprenyl-diphosphate phosphatase [Alphaproteobacteria bacterium]|nr:undecaprenyl-diphosphate phosphatase [Alphaproteobacteria bacterium]
MHNTLTAPHGHCTAALDTSFVSLGYFKIAVLGVVQGISELLPISSTAHMRAIPAFLGWPDPGSAFSATMQLAALAAVIVYFRNDLARVWRGFVRAAVGGTRNTPEFRLGVSIIIATIPIVIVGELLSGVLNRCGSPLRTPMVIGIACFAMAVLMGVAELAARHRRNGATISYVDAVLIGIAQIGALIPGVSRSGSTLTGALFLGFRREDAARVSFLLGIPAIAAAGLREIWQLHKAGLPSEGWKLLAVGILVASASAFVAIWGLMRLLERSSTWPLIVYRALFGIALVVAAAMHWIG